MDNFPENDRRIFELNERMKALIRELNEILSRLLFAVEVLKQSQKDVLTQVDLGMLYSLQNEYMTKYKEVEIIIDELRVLLTSKGESSDTSSLDGMLETFRRFNKLSGNDFSEN